MSTPAVRTNRRIFQATLDHYQSRLSCAHLRELLRQVLVLRWRQFPHLSQQPFEFLLLRPPLVRVVYQ
ncbi:MAG: hypothetical protein ACYCZQ_11295 [Burkholderiales bacterium]